MVFIIKSKTIFSFLFQIWWNKKDGIYSNKTRTGSTKLWELNKGKKQWDRYDCTNLLSRVHCEATMQGAEPNQSPKSYQDLRRKDFSLRKPSQLNLLPRDTTEEGTAQR